MTDAYRIPDVIARLDFAEGYWAGADVEVRLTVPLALYFAILEAVDGGNVAVLRGALQTWATEVLVGWNLHDRHGAPVPATPAGFESLPLVMSMDLVRTWLNKVPEIDLPSAGGSPGTATSGARRALNRRRRS
ncbi:MAG TPA: hypothetical protein VLM76_11665 [Patescibacteria group bacterium]|nr:hypothetical protein [Patescibacteria group bacterium]